MQNKKKQNKRNQREHKNVSRKKRRGEFGKKRPKKRINGSKVKGIKTGKKKRNEVGMKQEIRKKKTKTKTKTKKKKKRREKASANKYTKKRSRWKK